jgi:hypothetical protein
MRGAHVIMGMVLFVAVLSGCNKKACERYCSCDELRPSFVFESSDGGVAFASIDPRSSDCESECEDALDEEDGPCRLAFRSAARCLDQLDCDPLECEDPILDVESECSF